MFFAHLCSFFAHLIKNVAYFARELSFRQLGHEQGLREIIR
jgi:hypothetical protein